VCVTDHTSPSIEEKRKVYPPSKYLMRNVCLTSKEGGELFTIHDTGVAVTAQAQQTSFLVSKSLSAGLCQQVLVTTTNREDVLMWQGERLSFGCFCNASTPVHVFDHGRSWRGGCCRCYSCLCYKKANARIIFKSTPHDRLKAGVWCM
jgi:hypothetical protein